MKRVKIIIEGDVQGVFFRVFIKNCAEDLNIKGYVQNIGNHIEAILEGENLSELIEICKKGPKNSKVINIKITKQKYTGEFKDFKILR